MEKEWAATGYDDRFFDDDWEEISRIQRNAPKPDPVYPFKDLKESEWKETGFTWEDEDSDALADPDALFVESGPSAGPGRTAAPPPPTPLVPSPSSTIRMNGEEAPVEQFHDLTEREEAEIMGFASGLDADRGDAEPEGPPMVMLAGFRAEELPRVRELLDEVGGHDVPVVPVPQEYLTRPLLEALRLPEPDWERPRNDGGGHNRGGEFGSKRCVVFSGLDRGEMATIVSAIESRGLPRLVTVVVTAGNCEKTLGEALAMAVQDARSDARRKVAARNVDVAAAIREIESAAARENLTAAQLVQREIERQDASLADRAAALSARDARATRAEAHMEQLKREYLEKAKSRAETETAFGNVSARDDVNNPAGWPTLEDVEASASENAFASIEMEDASSSGGSERDEDALARMVSDAAGRVKSPVVSEIEPTTPGPVGSFAAEPFPERANARGEPPKDPDAPVEPEITTRRVLRELAMRRGVSYADLVRKAEASGIELPEE